MHTYITYVYTYRYTYIHSFIHTHTHTQTHTRKVGVCRALLSHDGTHSFPDKGEQNRFKYGSEFLSNIHSKAVRDKCDPSTYVCDDQTLSSVYSVMSCLDDVVNTETFFGRVPTDFNGATGYSDFLSSIADNAYVYREGLTLSFMQKP
jgi:hypothetical protein